MGMSMRTRVFSLAVVMLTMVAVSGVLRVTVAAQAATAQGAQTTAKPPVTPPSPANTPGPAPTPADYVIGPDDVLSVFTWKEKDFSGDFVVRPDGKLTMPLLNDIQAAGLTTDQLREVITAGIVKFVPDAAVTVTVKQINSRKVYITGLVNKPGTYPLNGPMSVLQLIALAGGLQEFADEQHIVVVRGTQSFTVNYKDLKKRRNLKQNIELKPGDTIIVS